MDTLKDRWKKVGFALGLLIGAAALWLKYRHGMPMRDAAVALMGVTLGPFATVLPLCCSDDFLRTNDQSRPFVEKIGVLATRFTYVLLGLLLIGFGVWLFYDHFGRTWPDLFP